jgi:hypothetical protein
MNTAYCIFSMKRNWSIMNIKIDGDDLLKHMMFWSEKTDDDCVEMATVEDKLDAEQALINMMERDFALEFNKEVIKGLKNLGTEMTKDQAKDKLIEVLMTQVVDLSMMSKIELGDDVIAEINRLKKIINE